MLQRKFEVHNESSQPVNRAVLARIGRKVLERQGVKEAVVNIVVVDNREISQLNEQYLNHKGPTDVITFQYDDNPVSADLFISSEQARKQAVEYKVSSNNELARLVIHGLLHLTGYSDDTPGRRGSMHRREDSLLAEIGQLKTVCKWIKG
ncbi:rRNA maturation RNase YbeY [bacterium]|nr:rRNA maturation RNase YbeY [bacterium]